MLLLVFQYRCQRFALPILAMLFLASCGSYQQTSYYDGYGIYTQGNQGLPSKMIKAGVPENDTYSNYFGQRATAYRKILQDETFVGIDRYSGEVEKDSTPVKQPKKYSAYTSTYTPNPTWRNMPVNTTIYVYDPWGWNYPYWGFNYGWRGYNSWGWGYPYWGFNYGWRGYDPWGWSYPYWGYGYGWGGYYGYSWYSPYYYNKGYSNSITRGRSNVTSPSRRYTPQYSTGRSNTSRSSSGYQNTRSYRSSGSSVPQSRTYGRSSGSYGRSSGAVRSSSGRSGGRR